ncbi:MAG: hypothetical protein KBT34_07980 [Prevotella sp.]|nr:hypothetical protein [Candidatus Prevotella equi]
MRSVFRGGPFYSPVIVLYILHVLFLKRLNDQSLRLKHKEHEAKYGERSVYLEIVLVDSAD